MASSTIMSYYEKLNGNDTQWIHKELKRLDILLKDPDKLKAISPTVLPLLEEARQTLTSKLLSNQGEKGEERKNNTKENTP